MTNKHGYIFKGAKARTIPTTRRGNGPRIDKGHFHFRNPDAPDYKKFYGSTYTERQLKILSGEIPWEVVRLNQLTLLANKAQAMGDDESHRIVLQLIECKKSQKVYTPQITANEAREILKNLTPDSE